MLSATGLLVAILGGRGTLLGPLLGGLIFAALPETLRFVDEYRIAIFAALLLAVIRFQPRGLIALLPFAARASDAPVATDLGELAFEETPPLRIENLAKRFGGLTAVDDVSMAAAPRELLGIIGPNGAGKTTFLSLASGFIRPSEGVVRYGDALVAERSPSELVTLGLTRTFQQASVCSAQSAFENVLAAASATTPESVWACVVRRSSYRSREERRMRLASTCLSLVGLADAAATPAGSLPYGEQKMLSIAVAMAAAPKMLLLDEPAAGLNHTEANRLAELLRRLRDRGLTLIWSTTICG